MPSALIRMDIAEAQRTFRFEKAAMHELLQGRTGPVARDLVRRAIRVEAAAKVNATNRPGPRVRTGRLRGSITWRLGSGGGGLFSSGLYADIGTAVIYAPYLELGTTYMPAYPFLRPALAAARI